MEWDYASKATGNTCYIEPGFVCLLRCWIKNCLNCLKTLQSRVYFVAGWCLTFGLVDFIYESY